METVTVALSKAVRSQQLQLARKRPSWQMLEAELALYKAEVLYSPLQLRAVLEQCLVQGLPC